MNRLLVFFASIFFMCFFFQSSFGQRGKITGAIVDKQSKENLIAVSVILYKAQDTVSFQALTTDLSGSFSFNKLPDGQYSLVIKAFGYEKYFNEELKINDSIRNIHLGTIELGQEASEIDGVVITAQKSFVEREAGKIIINVDRDPAGASDNVFELLKRVPGVTIENDETIKLNGKTGVLILINNKNTYL